MSNYIGKVSIVIPSKNEAHKLYKCLEGIKSQSVQPKEIIVIDSGSTDGTQDLVKRYEGARLIEIAPTEFNHGATRNLGVKHATGEYVLFTVQDAWACDSDWIKKLTDVFDEHDVVAVCGLQAVPHEKDANPVEWFRPQSQSVISVYKYSSAQFEQLLPAEKKKVSSIDNVNTIYKRDVLLEYPFDHVMDSEDMIWAKNIYSKGYALAFNPAARVYHTHTEDWNYFYKRTLLNAYLCYTVFGDIRTAPDMSIKKIISILRLIMIADKLSLPERVKWIKYNLMMHNSIKQGIEDFKKLLQQGEDTLEENCAYLIKKGLERV